jgi:hypothetical protein
VCVYTHTHTHTHTHTYRDIDYVEVCRFFDMRAWNEDEALLPWHGRTERLKHADACYEIEEEQASFLKRPT